MDAATTPFRSIACPWRAALSASRTAWRLALDIALPTLCISCEPVHGEGVCAACWSKLSFIFIAKPYCPRLGIAFVYDPGPELLSMEAIADPPAYDRARAAVRYDDIAHFGARAQISGPHRSGAGHGRLDGAPARNCSPTPTCCFQYRLRWRRGFGHRYNQSGLLARDCTPDRRGPGGYGAAPGARDRTASRVFARTAREQCAGRISGIRWPPGRRRGTARRLVDDVLTLGCDSGCLRASTFAGEGGPCRRAGLRPGCGWPPLSHILTYNLHFPRQTCP
jgi:Double zinc ribbon domain